MADDPRADDTASDSAPDDVLVVGEALVDIVIDSQGVVLAEHPGGSPANVALGLGRLGRRVSLLTRVGDDERGRSIVDHLRASDVRLTEGSLVDDATSTAAARLNADGVASYDFDIDWRLPEGVQELLDANPATALHTGSIAAFLAPGGNSVLDLVRAARGRTTVSYDPNARPRLMGDADLARERVERFVALCDLVKVSDEDLDWLCPGEDVEQVAARWLAAGPAIVVVTRGGNGAVALCRSGRAEVAGRPITVVDTVGAGDSFTSGLLDHLAGVGLLGADRLEALRAIDVGEVEAMMAHAVRISAITCQRAGADPPRRDELDAAASV